ncbi:NADH-quinone oxidoreductase subunit C [Sphingomonas sp.]|jgi:NADH-quinone oxidoreductase subunit C|uniref:NADH-quinone oxidoreductase subunit C n=1 Tax=Sphingomonas sp. TaxID=28214 RepID=UPI002DE41F26|nr:NADH-quinone oxidoreductase subunit C [Sphingomonas sp.]HEV2568382.1 NADH-quinone oxidoreductase subunit C [Sphingomonas sp.]
MLSPAPRIASNEGVIDAVRSALGGAVLDAVEHVYEVTLIVDRDSLVETMRTLRDQFAYQQLMEIAGVDYPSRPERFEVVYHLLSVTRNHRIRVKVSTDEDTPVPSVTGLWPVAGWLEREAYDMYGILFDGNPDLRRILTDYGFRGHPLRKDFPMTGYVEMRYSEEHKRVIYEPVKLAQDFRAFDFTSPWEGAEYVLPGDEKAVPEAKGAPTPLTADQISKAGTVTSTAAKPPVEEVKVTESVKETGAGQPHPGNQPQEKPVQKDGAPAEPPADKAQPETAEPVPPRTTDLPEGKNG